MFVPTESCYAACTTSAIHSIVAAASFRNSVEPDDPRGFILESMPAYRPWRDERVRDDRYRVIFTAMRCARRLNRQEALRPAPECAEQSDAHRLCGVCLLSHNISLRGALRTQLEPGGFERLVLSSRHARFANTGSLTVLWPLVGGPFRRAGDQPQISQPPSPSLVVAPCNEVTRFQFGEVCGQTFDTERQDQVFHHGPESHCAAVAVSTPPSLPDVAPNSNAPASNTATSATSPSTATIKTTFPPWPRATRNEAESARALRSAIRNFTSELRVRTDPAKFARNPAAQFRWRSIPKGDIGIGTQFDAR
jgi:hypothetical protein